MQLCACSISSRPSVAGWSSNHCVHPIPGIVRAAGAWGKGRQARVESPPKTELGKLCARRAAAGAARQHRCWQHTAAACSRPAVPLDGCGGAPLAGGQGIELVKIGSRGSRGGQTCSGSRPGPVAPTRSCPPAPTGTTLCCSLGPGGGPPAGRRARSRASQCGGRASRRLAARPRSATGRSPPLLPRAPPPPAALPHASLAMPLSLPSLFAGVLRAARRSTFDCSACPPALRQTVRARSSPGGPPARPPIPLGAHQRVGASDGARRPLLSLFHRHPASHNSRGQRPAKPAA